MESRLINILLLVLTSVFCMAQEAKPALSVNGEPVSLSEYYRRMEFLTGVGTFIGERFVEMPPAFLTMERIINEKLILQLAKKKGVLPTPGEVDNEYRLRKSENPDLVQRLTDLGVTEADQKNQILVEMAQFNLLTMGVTVTDQQIVEHYNNNKFIYATTPTVKLRVIVVRTEADRAKVDTALKTKDFATVARELSVDLTKYDGGDLPQVAVDKLPQNVRNVVDVTPPGSNTPWVESQGAFLLYRVESKTEAKQLPLDDKLKKVIRNKMMLDMGRAKNNVKAMLDDMRKSAKIEITSPGLQKLWNTYIQEYLKALGSNGGR